MTDREKLIEMMFSYQDEHNSLVVDKGGLADHLIAHGVTFSKDTDIPSKLVSEAISYFKYGVAHDIFAEPVTTYANLAAAALEDLFLQMKNKG